MKAKDAHPKVWSHKREHGTQGIQKSQSIIHELTMIDGMAIKGKHIIKSSQLQMQILKQLHSNNMGIEKTRLIVCKLVYWVNMNPI